jgi:hypothetical protein
MSPNSIWEQPSDTEQATPQPATGGSQPTEPSGAAGQPAGPRSERLPLIPPVITRVVRKGEAARGVLRDTLGALRRRRVPFPRARERRRNSAGEQG